MGDIGGGMSCLPLPSRLLLSLGQIGSQRSAPQAMSGNPTHYHGQNPSNDLLLGGYSVIEFGLSVLVPDDW